MKMTARFPFICGLLLLCLTAQAQTYNISGHLSDATDATALIGVNILLTNTVDITVKNGAVSDMDGNFMIPDVLPGSYRMELNYLGYRTVTRTVNVTDQDISLGTINMTSVAKELKGVTVAGKQIRAEQNGDTSSFRADAYKTNPDASAEDLVGKMPGVTSDNIGVKVNGETVQQIYVDGKPFFGTDPTLALKNLPAEVIDKIQIFDKLSDQSNFTGFDDGTSQKTMNIITKRNKSEGMFGKVYAGYGTDDRYIAGGNLNVFNGDQRISILGLSNNINQQNFSSEDILGATGGSGQNRGGSRGGGGNRGGGPSGGSGGANNFLVGQQGGIATTNSIGLNYSDNWGKKIKVSGSYFYNNTDNVNTSSIVRNYFTTPEATNVYNENDQSEGKNSNHRFNLRFEYTIDSSNSLIFTPSLSLQQNTTTSNTNAESRLSDILSSTTNNNTLADNHGYNSSNNLLFQHKFKKARRTISLNMNAAVNEKIGDGSYYSSNAFNLNDTGSTPTANVIDQQYTLYNNGSTLSGNLTYTEPIGKKGQLMISYNPSYSQNSADKETFDLNGVTHEHTVLDTQYSNKIFNTYTTQKGGISYRIGDKKLNFNVGASLQNAVLNSDQQFPTVYPLSRSFNDVLPNAMFNYRYADGRNLRIMYRTNVNAPSVTQLQNVVDISNPLLLKTGNAELRQTYEQTLILRYGLTKAKTARNFFLNLYAGNINHYIANATYIPRSDSLFTDPVTGSSTLIKSGGQLTRPVNLDGYWSTRSFLTYGLPVDLLKSNLNFNGGFNYNRIPGLVNNVINYSNNYIPSFGIVLSSNISENVDFTLSYSGNYNIVKNSIQAAANNNYYSHVASLRFNWIFLENFVFNTNVSNNYYTAFSSTGDQSYFLWNAYLGYKFFKKTLEARISVYDMLNQNTSISRNVTETYIENTNTKVLKQYFLFQLTYTIRNFKGTASTGTPPPQIQGDMRPPFSPGGERGPGPDPR